MSKKIKISYGCGYGRHEDVETVEDEMTDEEIEELVRDIVFNKFDWGWVVEEEK